MSAQPRRRKQIYVLAVLDEQLQVDLEHRLQQTHVGALVQSNLVLPDVDNEDFTCRQRKEGTLALKVLVLAALATVCAFHVHDQDVLCHARAARLALILAHPDSLGCLAALLLGHDAELGAKEVVEESRLAGGLRAEYGNEVVVEACWDNMFDVEVFGDLGAVLRRLVSCLLSRAERPERTRGGTHLKTLSSSMTWTPCSYASLLASSPTLAKWAFIIMPGAVGCRTLPGRVPLTLRRSEAILDWRSRGQLHVSGKNNLVVRRKVAVDVTGQGDVKGGRR